MDAPMILAPGNIFDLSDDMLAEMTTWVSNRNVEFVSKRFAAICYRMCKQFCEHTTINPDNYRHYPLHTDATIPCTMLTICGLASFQGRFSCFQRKQNSWTRWQCQFAGCVVDFDTFTRAGVIRCKILALIGDIDDGEFVQAQISGDNPAKYMVGNNTVQQLPQQYYDLIFHTPIHLPRGGTITLSIIFGLSGDCVYELLRDEIDTTLAI